MKRYLFRNNNIRAKLLSGSSRWESHFKRVDGQNFDETRNPGVTLSNDFISLLEEEDLLKELLGIKEKYGFQSSNSQFVHSACDSSARIKMTADRVTGRSEMNSQMIAPWSYGDNFESNKIPLKLSELVTKLEMSHNHIIKSKTIRDITIDYRYSSMFKVDPYIDPLQDGGNIFIINLESDLVFTITPDLASVKQDYAKTGKVAFKLPMKIRSEEAAIAMHSWTDEDIDILLKKRSVLHLHGDARYKWKHAVRMGVQVDGTGGICDWFGDLNTLIKRSESRVSIIISFE